MDAWVKKDEHFENQKCYLRTKYISFDFLNVYSVSLGDFFTFLISLAHGVARRMRRLLYALSMYERSKEGKKEYSIVEKGDKKSHGLGR